MYMLSFCFFIFRGETSSTDMRSPRIRDQRP